MLKSIDKIFWAILGTALPSAVLIRIDSWEYIIFHMDGQTTLFVLSLAYIIIPALYVFLVTFYKKCSLLFISFGFLLSIKFFYAIVPIDKSAFFPGMGHTIYELYALAFSIIIAVFALLLSPKKPIIRYANYMNDALDRAGNKCILFLKKSYNYIKKIFTDD